MISVIRKQAAADDFEVKLSNVADAEITQRLPSLTEYKVGFQLIDRDDDGTRGVGVMVYQIGDQWLYVPCFFLNGRIRGYDMMYLPERSQFVAAKDSWVTYLKSNQATTLGEKSGRLSKSKPKRADAVSLRRDGKSRSIMFKGASEGLVKDVAIENMTTVFNDYDPNMFDLQTWIPRLGKTAAVSFLTAMNESPDFANAILAHYEPDMLVKIAEAVKDTTPAKDGSEVQDGTYSLDVEEAVHNSDLQIVTEGDTAAVQNLDDKAKEVVLRDGLYVVDKRKKTSTVFTEKQDSGSLSTPAKNGYYEILLADGSFRKCYVIVRPKRGRSWKRAHGGSGGNTVDQQAFTYVVIDLDRPNLACECDRPILSRMLADRDVTKISGLGIKPTSLLRKFGPANDAKDEPVTISTDDEPVTISTDEGDKLSNYDWNHCIAIDVKGNYEEFNVGSEKSILGDKIAGITMPDDSDEFGSDQGTMHLTGQKGYVCRKGAHLYIPEGARVVAFRPYCSSSMPLGDLETIKHKIIKTAGWRGMSIHSDGTSFAIDGMFGTERMLTKNAALIKLVKEHGIAAPDARQMLTKQASVGKPIRTEYLIKYAETVYDDDERTNIPYEDVVPREEQETLDPETADMDVDKVVDASEKGVKDVMDVSVLKALASNGSPSRMVEDYMQDLLLALDRIGRILFMFYWHYNQFKDQYGQEKMSELEDSLRDNFQNLSELTLFLHKSTSGDGANLFADELTENFE